MLEHWLQVSLPHLLQWCLLTTRLHSTWQLEQEEEELLGWRTGANSLQGDFPLLFSSLELVCRTVTGLSSPLTSQLSYLVDGIDPLRLLSSSCSVHRE